MDWNEDGKKDLLTGGHDGFVRIYINNNTDADPQFSNYSYLRAGIPNYDAGENSCPDVVDWNGDGKKDVICGGESGKISLLLNTGTNAAPAFSSSQYIQDQGVDLDPGSDSSPVAADWNGDGRLDLLVGVHKGNIYYYENLTTGLIPDFAAPVKLAAGGTTINVEYYARIEVFDWNNDSVLDLLSGNRNYSAAPSGGVFYFESMGPLSADGNTLSKATGGTINFALNGGVPFANRGYFLVGNVSGTEPGYTLPGGGVLPLNHDGVLNFIRNNHTLPMFTGFRGILDGTGKAMATLSLNGFPLAAGLTMHFAFTTLAPFDLQSNAVPVVILP